MDLGHMVRELEMSGHGCLCWKVQELGCGQVRSSAQLDPLLPPSGILALHWETKEL